MIKPYRCEEFKEYVKQHSLMYRPEFHHVFGSLGSLKSTDLLGVAVDPLTHREHQDDRIWVIEQLPKAIENLLMYVRFMKEGKSW